MLRSYAAAGLLVPAAVDGSSGYRYYSTGQLHRARIIALLRRAGIAVDQIAMFFANPDTVQLDCWDREIVSESTARRQAWPGLVQPWRWLKHLLQPSQKPR